MTCTCTVCGLPYKPNDQYAKHLYIARKQNRGVQFEWYNAREMCARCWDIIAENKRRIA